MTWLNATALAISVVGIGILVGMSRGGIEGETLAQSAQNREDQITIFSQAEPSITGPQITTFDWAQVQPSGPIRITLDPSDYPSSAVFHLEGLWIAHGGDDNICLRLFDLTVFDTVPASEVCDVSFPDERVFVRSTAFNLPTGERTYTLGGRVVGDQGASLFAARLIAEWIESPPETPTPAPAKLWGDVNCDGQVNAVDALATLRWTAALPVNQVAPCPTIGATYP